jgi:uncharacterized protein YlxW (UPF0749 family)
MPAWLIPALKAVLPHIGTIVSAATPVFTKKSTEAAANQMQLLQQQITELQAAASANDAHIKALATQLQSAVTALELGAATMEKRLQRALWMAAAAAGLSAVAVCVATLQLLQN